MITQKQEHILISLKNRNTYDHSKTGTHSVITQKTGTHSKITQKQEHILRSLK